MRPQMIELSLLRRGSRLADPAEQLRVLAENGPDFREVLHQNHLPILTAQQTEILQVNVGKLCNQTCRHCHVDAGPDRREVMTSEVAQACLSLLARYPIPTLDITGGAPEMTSVFRDLVMGAGQLHRRVIDRCNLTILMTPGYEDLAEFLAENQVEIIASLPCYLESNVDKQRGDRVFRRSIDALQRLNALGYGQSDSQLILNLVYNPTGPSLPPDQASLEADYRRELQSRFGIVFSRLMTITNLPISRFLDDLVATDRLQAYQQKLIDAFNPATVQGLMCRNTLSIDWQGFLFDCDFNQMLDLASQLTDSSDANRTSRLHVSQLDDSTWQQLQTRPIVTRRHCFGCTAGAGSSCQGSLTAS